MNLLNVLQIFLENINLPYQNTVDYICGNGDALPLPLSAEEEGKMLAKLALEGSMDEFERAESDLAKSELIQHNLRLVVYIARKFDNTGVENDDLISIGTIGLIKAINSFKADKNIKLATYASRCIENEILMYLRRTARLKSEVSFDEPLNTDFDGNELLLSDVLGTSAESVYGDIESNAEKEQLKEALTKLSERERKIMFLRFGLGGNEEMTQKDVADLLGISQSYISRLEKKIILQLKEELTKQSY
jgi:RNA polymerase sporulation-specific sigma factor